MPVGDTELVGAGDVKLVGVVFGVGVGVVVSVTFGLGVGVGVGRGVVGTGVGEAEDCPVGVTPAVPAPGGLTHQ